jgi:hypothetical protein
VARRSRRGESDPRQPARVAAAAGGGGRGGVIMVRRGGARALVDPASAQDRAAAQGAPHQAKRTLRCVRGSASSALMIALALSRSPRAPHRDPKPPGHPDHRTPPQPAPASPSPPSPPQFASLFGSGLRLTEDSDGPTAATRTSLPPPPSAAAARTRWVAIGAAAARVGRFALRRAGMRI